jgi:hypothetical protein
VPLLDCPNKLKVTRNRQARLMRGLGYILSGSETSAPALKKQKPATPVRAAGRFESDWI